MSIRMETLEFVYRGEFIIYAKASSLKETKVKTLEGRWKYI